MAYQGGSLDEFLEVFEYDLINQNILFVDGLTRVGKSALNQLITGISGVTHPQFIPLLEHIAPLISNGMINNNAASALMRLHLNELVYNFEISRNLNFRHDDLSSVLNARDPSEFHRNLAVTDGDWVLSRASTRVHQFQTHDILTHFKTVNSLGIPFLLLELVRNPIDTIFSWYTRGWGRRFDEADPRAFTMLFKSNEAAVPHYLLGLQENYFELNEIEKCVVLHNHLIRRSIAEFNAICINDRKRITIIRFEEMVSEPEKVMDTVCAFLNRGLCEQHRQFFEKAGVPRSLDKKKHLEKREYLNARLRGDIKEDLDFIDNLYNSRGYYECI